MKVPFVDLRAQYQSLKHEIDATIAAVIEETAFIGGRFVQEFELAFAADYGVKHCIPVANGTDAIYIALKMLGIGTGDEVITTAHSWISTSEAITQTGARPVFVDVDQYFTIDAGLIEAAITPRTRAILPVHLFGQAADMGAIMEVAAKHRLFVVEDCAQAHYAQWQGRRIGTFGNVGTFSFYPGKNLGAYGDAGAIVTNDDALARNMRMYANHGALKKHQHVMEGVNSRLDGLQAAILRAKLPHVHEWTQARRVVARWYDELLADVDGIETPRVRPGGTHVYHLYVIKTKERDALQNALAAEGIETAVHYPAALPALEPYRQSHDAARGAPRAVENSGRILSLPIYAELTEASVGYIAAAIMRFRLRVR
jgi:dTDP-4-amino-4,6-dideoxygalactose transaminase